MKGTSHLLCARLPTGNLTSSQEPRIAIASMTLTDKNPESSLSLHEDPDESYDSHAAKLRHDLGAGKWAAESGLPNDQYAADRNADVHGTANPTLMEKPFWKYMVYEKLSAYRARDIFEAPKDPFDYPNPVWCFERSGATRTKLPDGRIVCIGGEHEDFYDPDFYIYNGTYPISGPSLMPVSCH